MEKNPNVRCEKRRRRRRRWIREYDICLYRQLHRHHHFNVWTCCCCRCCCYCYFYSYCCCCCIHVRSFYFLLLLLSLLLLLFCIQPHPNFVPLRIFHTHTPSLFRSFSRALLSMLAVCFFISISSVFSLLYYFCCCSSNVCLKIYYISMNHKRVKRRRLANRILRSQTQIHTRTHSSTRFAWLCVPKCSLLVY